jgi:DNA polymerase III subunit gamma/tau
MPVGSYEVSASQQTKGALALAPQPTPVAPSEGPRLVAPESAEEHSLPEALQPAYPQSEPHAGTQPVEVATPVGPDPLHIEPEAGAAGASSGLEALQAAMVSALAATKGQRSASEQVEEATLALNGDTLEIQTTLSKTMLPVVLNADCERILKNVLRDQGHAELKLKLLPGSPSKSESTPKKTRSAPAGSAKELAANHPVVQEAQRLFSAEIRNVIDLRKP